MGVTGLKKTIGIIVIVLGVAALSAYVYEYVFPFWDMKYVADLVGGVINPVFAFACLMLLLVILQLLREQLKLKISVAENQVFENSFYALLEQHNTMLLEADPDNIDDFIRVLLTVSQTCDEARTQLLKSKISAKYRGDLSIDSAGMSIKNIPINQCFLMLYQILILIASSCQTSSVRNKKFTIKNLKKSKCSAEEMFYANIVRAFLTDEMCYLLMIYCYCHDERDTGFKYKLLIERYSMLAQLESIFTEELPDYIPDTRLLSQFESKFEGIAFGKGLEM